MAEIENNPQWEQGSEFHLLDQSLNSTHFAAPWDQNGLFYGSGRDAMKALLIFGMNTMGWKRLLVPAYFCQTVVKALLETGITVQCYRSWYPGEREENKHMCEVLNGDVALAVNHFGLKREITLGFDISKAAAVIEDHTHDPFSSAAMKSGADYCIASLRKTLPVPDGGVLWSPRNKALPVPPLLTAEHRLAAGEKLEAMRLKGLFLKGEITDKSGYRTLFLSGEKNMSGGKISAISEWSAENLGSFPVLEWREMRKQNYQMLFDALSSLSYVTVLPSASEPGSVPFSCILLFDRAERREFVRQKLIQKNIFPAILWSLEKPAIEGIPMEYIDAGKRMLSLHCDMRYSPTTMKYIAKCIKESGDDFKDQQAA